MDTILALMWWSEVAVHIIHVQKNFFKHLTTTPPLCKQVRLNGQ